MVRTEDVAPRTWLLAALAAWALIAWVLAIAGMGRRIVPLADDASLLQPLPAMRAPPPERLGPLGQYDESVQRPLFSDDRRPKPFSLRGEGEGEEEAGFDYILTSVILTPTLKMAVLQPAEGDQGGAPGESIRVRLGEAPEQAASWRLSSLDARSAVFQGPDGEQTLALRVFDGTGGLPPTPASSTRPAPGRPPATVTDADGPAARDAANAARAAADAANAAPVSNRPQPPKASPQPAETAPTTSDAQIEAIRQRIQARREQLRREAGQATPANNP